MIRWPGWLMVLYGAGHTIGALTVEGAANHAGAWFRGDLRSEAFSEMSPAGSAYWFSLSSFGPMLILLGLLVVWMHRHQITPPAFIPLALIVLTVIDAWIIPFTPWPIFLAASIVLLVGIRRAGDRRILAPNPAT